MAGYAVGHLHEVSMGPGIVEWALIVIEFPDLDSAHAWYESPAYQEILPLRADNSRGDILLVDGAGDDHLATDVLA